MNAQAILRRGICGFRAIQTWTRVGFEGPTTVAESALMTHEPVLYDEVMRFLAPQAGGRYIDGTLGAGGHTAGLLAGSAPDGRVLAFDRDPEAIAFARRRLGAPAERLTTVNASFAEMGTLAPANGFTDVDGILLDLGLSSRQLDDPARGFSFRFEAPLDMRFDPAQSTTAADLINTLSAEELADIFYRYGEERHSRRIARTIVARRPLRTTRELADLVAGLSRGRSRIHPATRVFQALRIAVNDELGALERVLPAARDLLASGGRLAIISFHSLEDRMVKHQFREWSKSCICPPRQPICTCDHEATVEVLTRQVVTASEEEIARNPRSRSARLRVMEKL